VGEVRGKDEWGGIVMVVEVVKVACELLITGDGMEDVASREKLVKGEAESTLRRIKVV